MASIDVLGSVCGLVGNQLQALLVAADIQPGDQPGYELCKVLYSYHPHGAKLVDYPIQMAQYKPRVITVPGTPDDGKVWVEAFLEEWKKIKAERLVLNTGRLSRMYGVATLGIVIEGADTKQALDFKELSKQDVAFNVWDPLNTAGSLVLSQDPNSPDYQKPSGVSVNNQVYHRNRVVVLQNEDPLYIEYQSSGFGFTGRSVYQRGLFPLKSFVLSMATDAMVTIKAGVIIAKVQSQSSAVDGVMSYLMGQKRQMVKEAQTNNVISIGLEESIESLDLTNTAQAMTTARKNIIENEAAACGTPAKIVLAETFAEGFGEGTEDAKAIAQFVDGIRAWLGPVYDFLDEIVMYRAWNEEFYETVREKYTEQYGGVSYAVAFNEARNSFTAQWPNLLEETDKEKREGDKVVLEAIISVVEVLLPALPPDQKALVIEWMVDCLNSKKRLFEAPLQLDFEEIAKFEPVVPGAGGEGESDEGKAEQSEPKPPKPKGVQASNDSTGRPRRERLDGVDAEVRRTAVAAVHLLRGKGAAAGVV